MPDGRHHNPHVEGELIRAGLCEEVALKEHAGSFADLIFVEGLMSSNEVFHFK